MKISFILPVYKVETFLEECVYSLLSQTYTDFEIILVDDGSPDRCPVICDTLATKDARIKVLHKINGGLSDARNYGLKYASGDFVIFVDSDDLWISSHSLQELIYKIEQFPDCNFYCFNCQYYYPQTKRYKKWVEYSEAILSPISGNTAINYLVASGTFPMSAWLKIINRQWLLSTQITFKVGQLSEDIPWFINLLDKTEKCVFINNYVYAYRQNVSGSITAALGERNYDSLIDIVKHELEILDTRTFTTDAIDSLKSFLAYEVSILMSFVHKLPASKRKVARKELKSLCYLLQYTKNPKVRMVSIVYNIFGYAITERVLRLYNWYRSRK